MRLLVGISLALVAACSGGTNDRTTPTSENRQLSSPGQARQAIGVNSVLWPNEPAGYIHFGTMTGDAIPTTTGYTTPTGYVGKWKVFAGLPNNISLTTDASAPGDSNLITFAYPESLTVGSAPFDISFQPTDGVQRKALYFGAIFRIRSGGSDTTKYANQATGTKWLSYLGAVEALGSSSHNNFWFLLRPGGTRSSFHFDMKDGTGGSIITFPPNRDASNIIVVGDWIRFETVIELNTINTADGRWRVWLTNLTLNPTGPATLVHDSTSMMWRVTGAAQWFYGSDLWNFNPTWGGSNLPNKPQDDWFDVMEVRFSGTT